MKVQTSKCTIEDFNESNIENSLIQETDITPEDAFSTARGVHALLDSMVSHDAIVPASLIRELTCFKLMSYGLPEIRDQYTRVGLPVYDVTHIIEQGSKENANLHHNPETVHKFAGDAVLREYTFTKILPHDLTRMHMAGEIHVHDSDYFAVRPNCLQHDLRFFFEKGLMVDGDGKHTSVSAPPKHALTAILHAAKILASSQTNMAGGQSLDNFNVFIAPFFRGMPAREIKQVAQAFVYEMNMQYVARGGQVVFSNMNLELTMPDYLKDLPAIGARGEVVGTYADYECELHDFTSYLLDVFIEGDALGKPHLFPNIVVKVRPSAFTDPAQQDLLYKVHVLFEKYGTPYILNMCAGYQNDAVNSMGCRTRLSGDWAAKHGQPLDTAVMRCGNAQYITLNLPRVALDSNANESMARQILDERLKAIIDVLKIKRDIIYHRLETDKVLPFLAQKGKDGSRYIRMENMTYTVGFCGLNEYVHYMTGFDMHENPLANDYGLKTVKYMRDFTDKMADETDIRFTLVQSPAESTAGRFARLDYAKYGQAAKFIHGHPAKPSTLYYTNSSHVRVDADIDLITRAQIEAPYHKLTNGGHITHLFLGEGHPNIDGMVHLTEKLCKNTSLGLFDYTKDITMCCGCHTVNAGLVTKCQSCGSTAVEQYSRITGYCQRIGSGDGHTGGWNDAKVAELQDRKRYNILR